MILEQVPSILGAELILVELAGQLGGREHLARVTDQASQ